MYRLYYNNIHMYMYMHKTVTINYIFNEIILCIILYVVRFRVCRMGGLSVYDCAVCLDYEFMSVT